MRRGGGGRAGLRIHVSAKTGDGIESLREALLKLAGWQSGEEDVFMAR